jgi:hypothetical protein
MPRLIIGLVIPFVAVVGLLPLANDISWTVWEIPFLYIWMFAWFILTAGCLAVCWFCFDRLRDDSL